MGCTCARTVDLRAAVRLFSQRRSSAAVLVCGRCRERTKGDALLPLSWPRCRRRSSARRLRGWGDERRRGTSDYACVRCLCDGSTGGRRRRLTLAAAAAAVRRLERLAGTAHRKIRRSPHAGGCSNHNNSAHRVHLEQHTSLAAPFGNHRTTKMMNAGRTKLDAQPLRFFARNRRR